MRPSPDILTMRMFGGMCSGCAPITAIRAPKSVPQEQTFQKSEGFGRTGPLGAHPGQSSVLATLSEADIAAAVNPSKMGGKRADCL